MAEEFAGKVALVTGGASGIGEVVARMLAQQGASVLVVDLNEEGTDLRPKCHAGGGPLERRVRPHFAACS